MQKLEAHEVTLHKIFCSDYDFSVPDYQRPYAWELEQAAQLLDDLVEALERDSVDPYFLGSLVLVREKDASTAQVIDGQQRLTTLTILLGVLRDLTADEHLREALERMLIEPGDKILNLSPKPRLTLRSLDAAFFRTYVQTTGSIATLLALTPDALKTDAQRAIRANAKALHDVLAHEDWPEDRRLDLLRMISARTVLVVVSTPDLASAHRIFSVMNARGLDLSPADIFKSHIIGDLTPGVSGVYASKWEDAEVALGREDFADLFLHMRMIFSGKRAERELLKEFQEQVLDDRYLPRKAAEFIDDVLVPYADAYEQIRDQSYTCLDVAEKVKVNAWFRRLEQLDNNDWRPPALWAVRTFANDPVWLGQYLQALERLAASMLIRRVYATPRAQRYAALLRELADGAGLDAPSFELSEEEKQNTVAHLDGDLYLSTKVRKYVLLRLDEVISQDPGVTFSHPIITVEHILPQHPAANSNWISTFTEGERKQWTHRLGNLVLLNRRKNSGAQNYDFDEKKAKYFLGNNGVATFALTVQVLNMAEWTPEVLERRQHELLAALTVEWELSPGPVPGSSRSA